MYRTKKTKRFALSIALVLALVAAPQALAGPAFSGADLGATVYGWLAGLWSGISAVLVQPVDKFGPENIPNFFNGEPGQEFGPGTIPNGHRGDPANSTSDTEFGPLVIPDG